jgi:pimeloyl-ACP methyl ester carboxylesterase
VASIADSGDTRYARSGDVHIGYRVFGRGPVDLVIVQGLTSNLDSGFWAPGEAEELEALARLAHCLLFDKRGTGISDGVQGAPSLEERMDDLRAVMDAAGSSNAVILGQADGGATTTGERVNKLPRSRGGRGWQMTQRHSMRSPDGCV